MKEIIEYEIFTVGNYSLKIYNLIIFIVLIAAVFVILFVIKRIIYRSKTLDLAKKYTVNRLIQYIIVTIAFIAGLNVLGFNISVLLAGSAAILVGAGFGLQDLFSDFISGIVLLLDGSLKVGDIIEVNNIIYRVEEINFRTTRVIGRDENYIIMPNSELTENRVVNWTYNKVDSRFKINIGVDYSTDVILFMKLLKEVVQKNPDVLKEPEPFVRFEDYGDSALLFSVYFYTKEIFRVENIKSTIRVEIFKTLKNNGITIPFPQRVVHMTNQ